MRLMENQFEKDAMLLRSIHKILLKQWDPLKIKHLPSMRDEYEDYLPQIFKLLRNRASETEIFEYLWWVESKVLERQGNRDITAQAARDLFGLSI